jgi:hypothetical protein
MVEANELLIMDALLLTLTDLHNGSERDARLFVLLIRRANCTTGQLYD